MGIQKKIQHIFKLINISNYQSKIINCYNLFQYSTNYDKRKEDLKKKKCFSAKKRRIWLLFHLPSIGICT